MQMIFVDNIAEPSPIKNKLGIEDYLSYWNITSISDKINIKN